MKSVFSKKGQLLKDNRYPGERTMGGGGEGCSREKAGSREDIWNEKDYNTVTKDDRCRVVDVSRVLTSKSCEPRSPRRISPVRPPINIVHGSRRRGARSFVRYHRCVSWTSGKFGCRRSTRTSPPGPGVRTTQSGRNTLLHRSIRRSLSLGPPVPTARSRRTILL